MRPLPKHPTAHTAVPVAPTRYPLVSTALACEERSSSSDDHAGVGADRTARQATIRRRKEGRPGLPSAKQLHEVDTGTREPVFVRREAAGANQRAVARRENVSNL